MATADDVRRVGLSLPRAYEQVVRGRTKLKVKQLVFAALSHDETTLGFAFPKAERDGLVASDPGTFFLPGASDLRYQWVCARLSGLEAEELEELVTDAWRMCVPRFLHDLPELPAPAAQAWDLIELRDWAGVRPLLHPYLRFQDGKVAVRGRARLLELLVASPTPRPPRAVEVRDGQLYRWVR